MSTTKLLGDKKEEEKSQHDHEDMENIKKAVLYDELFTKTSDIIISSLSWTNAGLILVAMQSTFYLSNSSDLTNSWIVFIIALIVAITIIIVPLCLIKFDINKLKQEIIPDTDQQLSTNIKDKRPFFNKLELLLTSSISLVVSMTLRDAANLTFTEKIINQPHVESAAYILYAAIWTIFGVWITIRLTNYLKRIKKDLIETLDDNTDNISFTELKSIAIKQRYINLLLLTFGYIMAWSWRSAIDEFILNSYGGDKLTTLHVCIYCVIVTLFVSFLMSLTERYYCLYPKQVEIQDLFLKSKTREATNKLISDNCIFVVGLAWNDTAKVTLFYNSTNYILINVFLYWFISISLIFIGIIATHKFHKQKINDKIDKIGIMKWINKHPIANDNNNNNENENEISYTRYEIPTLFSKFIVKVVEVTIFCWSIAGSLLISEAVTYTILAIYANIELYDINDDYQRDTKGIWLQWVIVFLTLCLTATIMSYLKTLIQFFRKDRRTLMNKIFGI